MAQAAGRGDSGEAMLSIALLLSLLMAGTAASAQDPEGFAGAQALATFAPLDATRPITVFVATGADDSKFRASDRELAEWALNAWERSANGRLRFAQAPESSAQLRVYWLAANSGQYGEMQPILVDGRRGAAVYIRPDTEALGERIARRAREDPLFRDTVVYLTCLHELGHALGLEHTDAYEDIMYFFGYGGDIPAYFDRYRSQLRSREDITSVSGLSDNDRARLDSLYDTRQGP